MKKIILMAALFFLISACDQSVLAPVSGTATDDADSWSQMDRDEHFLAAYGGAWLGRCWPTGDGSAIGSLQIHLLLDDKTGTIETQSFKDGHCEKIINVNRRSFSYGTLSAWGGPGVIWYNIRFSFERPQEGEISRYDSIINPDGQSFFELRQNIFGIQNGQEAPLEQTHFTYQYDRDAQAP